MKILSLNVRVWTRDIKHGPNNWITRMKNIRWLINYLRPDILCFQELSFPANLFIPNDYKRINISFSHPIYVHKRVRVSNHKFKVFFDAVTIYDTVRIINVHSRWESEIIEKTCKQITKDFQDSGKHFAIICGDFNNPKECIKLDWANRVPFNEEVDTFINWNRPEESHGVIDHFYTVGFDGEAEVITDYGIVSDHFPILLTTEMY